jgi:uncharacterized protein
MGYEGRFMLRHTQGFVALLLQALMLIPSGLVWAQTTGGAAHFYTTLGGIHIYSSGAQDLITAVLSGALATTAAVLFLRKRILAFFADYVGELSPRRTSARTVLLGAMLGVMVSISSVGAGALGVTDIILLYPRLPTARIVGSDIAHGRAADPRRRHRPLDAGLDRLASPRLTARRLPTGDRFGSYVSVRVPDAVLRSTLAATLLLVAGKLAL